MPAIQRIDSSTRPVALFGSTGTRVIELRATAALPSHTLMRRAGEATGQLALALAPHSRTVWVAAGPGNNGGDGFEAASWLQQQGKRCVVTLTGDPAKAPADAKDAFERARAAGVSFESEAPKLASHDLAIDGLLGIGGSRAPQDRLADDVRRLNALACPVLAIDVPSGLNADTGQAYGADCVRATHTLTLLTLKPGLFTGAGRDQAGQVWFDPLGVDATPEHAPDAWLRGRHARIEGVARRHAAHKGTFDLATTEDREVPIVVTDFATAELVKVAANAFLATKISFINAMAEVCDAAGADVTQLAKSIGYDARIGNKFLRAGIGFGGGCLPKDIRAFQARAQELGAGEALRFLHEVDLINERRRTRVVKLAAELLDRAPGPNGPDFTGAKIAVLGATFKPNSDDVRDAPSLAVAGLLAKAGADVRVFDPEGMDNARKAAPDLAYETNVTDAVTGADLVCVLTEWADFRNADPVALGELVAGKKVIDGRNCLDATLWSQAGWVYRGMGRP